MLWILVNIAIVILIYEKRITLATSFTFYWLIFCISGTAFYKRIDMPSEGLVYIMSMVLLFYMGSLFAGNDRNRLLLNSKAIDIKSGVIFLKGAMIAALAVIVISVFRYGYSFLSIHHFLSISSSVRGADFGGRSAFEKIAMPFIFSAFALDGYFCAYSISLRFFGKRYKTALPALLAEMIILGILSTGKSLLIWAVILWISGFLSGNTEFLNDRAEKDRLTGFMKKHKWTILTAVILLIVCLMLMMFVRSQKGTGALIYNMINYGFAQVPCFSIWFSGIDSSSLQYSKGGQLIFGILDELKLSDGLYSNFDLNIELYRRGVFSNIYTVFRCVIEDFGMKGSAFFWFFAGMTGGIIEKKIQRKGKNVIYGGLLLSGYVFILFSFLISAWHYLTIALAVMFFSLELFYIKR